MENKICSSESLTCVYEAGCTHWFQTLHHRLSGQITSVSRRQWQMIRFPSLRRDHLKCGCNIIQLNCESSKQAGNIRFLSSCFILLRTSPLVSDLLTSCVFTPCLDGLPRPDWVHLCLVVELQNDGQWYAEDKDWRMWRLASCLQQL